MNRAAVSACPRALAAHRLHILADRKILRDHAVRHRTYREAFAFGRGHRRGGVCGPVGRCLRSAPRVMAEILISPARLGADPNSPSRDPTHRGRAQSRKLFQREFASSLFARLCADHDSPTTPTSVANPIVKKKNLRHPLMVAAEACGARYDGAAEAYGGRYGGAAEACGARYDGAGSARCRRRGSRAERKMTAPRNLRSAR
jgi:hypothetical protein